jgi:hypothetical protein
LTEGKIQLLDWVNLPERAALLSLWDCLHDAELRGIGSNLLARRLTLKFWSSYIPEFHGFPKELEFTFQLDGVQSARSFHWELWPGGCSVPEGVSREEENRLIAEYRAKWRENSCSWPEVESRLSREKQAPYVMDASFASGENGEVAIHVGVMLTDGEYYNLFVRAERLSVERTDGKPIDLERLIKLGEAYWEAYAARRPNTTGSSG